MDYETIESNREMYQRRADNLAPEGTRIGTVELPARDSSEAAFEVFHELMTDHGWLGIEYCNEAIHQEGGHYFDEMPGEDGGPQDMLEDFERYKESYDEYEA